MMIIVKRSVKAKSSTAVRLTTSSVFEASMLYTYSGSSSDVEHAELGEAGSVEVPAKELHESKSATASPLRSRDGLPRFVLKHQP